MADKHADAVDVTFLVGENGSGKSTLVEAIAVAAGFNPEGGTMGMRFTTRASHSQLHEALRLTRGTRRPRDGFPSVSFAICCRTGGGA